MTSARADCNQRLPNKEKNYDSFEEFLVDNNLTMTSYLAGIQVTLRRPTLVLKRNFSEIYTNAINPSVDWKDD